MWDRSELARKIITSHCWSVSPRENLVSTMLDRYGAHFFPPRPIAPLSSSLRIKFFTAEPPHELLGVPASAKQ
jgi:hypothetical protein